MRLLQLVLSTVAVAGSLVGQTYTITTFAGGGLPVNIPGTSASVVQVPQILLEELATLDSEIGCHLRRKARLCTQEMKILLVE